MPAYRKPTAVVLTTEGVFYDNGQRGPLRISLGDDVRLTEVLRGAEQLFSGGEGVIIIDATLAQAQASIGELVATQPEWKFPTLRSWTTFTRAYTNGTGTMIHLGLWGELERDPGPLLEGTQGAADSASRLGRYRVATGHPWRYTAGVSGCVGLRSWHTRPGPGQQPLWQHDGPRGVVGAGPLIWRASEQPDAGPVHVWDINAMYLAGLKNAALAWGKLEQTGARGFDATAAGWWEIDALGIPSELYDGKARPPVVGARRIMRGSVWVSTPTAKLLEESGAHLDVLDSWTNDNASTIGRTYAERLISARAGMLGPLGPGVEFAIKRTYAELVGMIARPGGSIHRPDWAATIMDLSRANMLRRVFRAGQGTGVWPVAVQTDAVYYVTRDPALVGTALGLGTGSGMFKNAGMLTVAEYRAKFGGMA